MLAVFVFRFCFQNDEWKSSLIEQEETDKPVPAPFEILPQRIDVALGDLDVVLQDDIRPALGVVEEPPAGFFEQIVDLDPCFGFLVHVVFQRSVPRFHV